MPKTIGNIQLYMGPPQLGGTEAAAGDGGLRAGGEIERMIGNSEHDWQRGGF